MTKIIKRLEVKDKKVLIFDIDKLKYDLELLADGEYILEIKPIDTRISRIRNYYWLCVTDLGKQIGYSKAEMHEEVQKHLPLIDGKIPSVGSMEADDLLQRIQQLQEWASLNFDYSFQSIDI